VFLRLGRCLPLALSLASLEAQPRHPDHHAAGFPALFDRYTATPSDAQGAVGLDHVMTMVNGEVLVQSRSGVARPGYPMPLAQFWKPLGDFTKLFDPRLLYDTAAARWIASAGANPGATDAALLLAVSKSGDPTGDWHFVRIALGADGFWGDYPTIGFNRKWIAISANLLALPPVGRYDRTVIYAFEKAALYGGTDSYLTFSDTQGELAPVVDPDGASEAMYFAQTFPGRLRIGKLDGDIFTAGGIEIPLSTTSAISSLTDADFAPQSGSYFKVDTGDSRLQNCVLRAGAVWCVHTAFFPAAKPTRSSVEWFAVDPTAAKLLQTGLIDDPAAAHFYAFPSITVNRDGDALIGYSRFAANEFPSAGYALRTATDPPGVFPVSAVAKQGESTYVGRGADTSSNRWGDFSATVVDPVDGVTFWTLQEFAATPTDHYPGRWGTWWTSVSRK